MAKMEHLENYPRTKTAPVGTENLPLEERIRVYIDVFESGCGNTQFGGVPEDCPECVRAFVEAIKKAANFPTISPSKNPLRKRPQIHP